MSNKTGSGVNGKYHHAGVNYFGTIAGSAPIVLFDIDYKTLQCETHWNVDSELQEVAF